ncbi:armadillo-type protein [Baffinella frigidus]|nr:armadillo-type protein [Cryptophyta sp. CCMP2293]
MAFLQDKFRLASLSVDEVCTVLRNLDLGKYEAGFRAVPVDGAIFSTVNDDGLREMGMDVGVLRTALLHRVSGFRAEGVALKLLVEAGGAPPDETTEAGGVPPETVESEAAKSRVQGSKDVGLIISLMGAHKSSVGVQEAGCVSLIMIVAGNAESQAATAAQGGVEAVLGAMGAHESIAIVQQWGCFALVNLAANAENKGAIAAKGGIVAVLRAMGAHASSAGVQEYGCWALGNLAGNVENAVAIAAQGGITAVLRAMGAHGPSAIVQEKGCWALHTIAWPDSGLRSQVRDAAAVPLVQKALAAFPGAVDLQEHGKGLLEKLSA